MNKNLNHQMLAMGYQFMRPSNSWRVVFAPYDLASRCSKHSLLITSSSLVSFPIHLTLLQCICSPLVSFIELIVSLIVSQSRHRSCCLAAGALFPSQHLVLATFPSLLFISLLLFIHLMNCLVDWCAFTIFGTNSAYFPLQALVKFLRFCFV